MQVDLSSQISMIIKLNLTDDKSNVCTIGLKDNIGINELSETIDKNNILEIINLLKEVYNQL